MYEILVTWKGYWSYSVSGHLLPSKSTELVSQFLWVSEGFLLFLWYKHHKNHICNRWMLCIHVAGFVLLNEESQATTDIWDEWSNIYNQLFLELIYGFIEYFVLLFSVTWSTLHGMSIKPIVLLQGLRIPFSLFPQLDYNSSFASIFLDNVLCCTWLLHSKAVFLELFSCF